MANSPIGIDSEIKKAIKDTIKLGKEQIYPIKNCKGLELRIRINKDSQTAAADFRHRYTSPISGKRPYMTLGKYDAFTLKQAIELYRQNIALIERNIDPIEHRDHQKQNEINERKNTLNVFIDEWYELQLKKNLSKSRYINIDNNLKPIKEKLGSMKVKDITPIVVIDLIESIQVTNTYKASRVKATLKAVLQRALIKRVIEYNPAANLTDIFITHKVNHKAALTAPADFAELLKEIDGLQDDDKLFRKQLLQLLALTFVRIGDLAAMKWNDIDFDAKQWRLTQQKGKNRNDMMPELIVPLAPQAMQILKKMQSLTGQQDYVFYTGKRKAASYANPREVNKLLESNELNKKGIGENYCGQGYKNVHTPHGFRAAAKTNLKRLLKKNPLAEDMTELQLGHKKMSQYGQAYDRWDLLEERTDMMYQWANYLDALKAGEYGNVIYLDDMKKLKAINE